MALAEENEELKLQLHLSAEYIKDVTEIIDQVQRNLQDIENREGIIGRISLSSEGQRTRAVNVRRQLITSIADIDAYIKDNRKKMELLQQRIQESKVRVASLERLVDNLNVAVKQKERDIVRLREEVNTLQENIASLEGQVEERDQELEIRSKTIAKQAEAIELREQTIREQEEAAATAFYVVDSRDGLKQKGLIVERGGFLGLWKDTKVGTIAQAHFQAVPKADDMIEFASDVQNIEIVSAHKDRPDLYSFQKSKESSQLIITDTEGFWALSEYLIIVARD